MSKIFDPDWGNTSLRTIFETEFPEPISLLPTTPGWWLVFFALLALVVRAAWRRRQHYLKDRYRRDALAQLSTIKAQLEAGVLEAARELAPLLRATAIAAAGREAMSGLQDEAYAEALAQADRVIAFEVPDEPIYSATGEVTELFSAPELVADLRARGVDAASIHRSMRSWISSPPSSPINAS